MLENKIGIKGKNGNSETKQPFPLCGDEATDGADIKMAEAQTDDDELARLRAETATLRALIARYRSETPLGHQPHMIAHEVDKALETPNVMYTAKPAN